MRYVLAAGARRRLAFRLRRERAVEQSFRVDMTRQWGMRLAFRSEPATVREAGSRAEPRD